jgi:hypothetical protein
MPFHPPPMGDRTSGLHLEQRQPRVDRANRFHPRRSGGGCFRGRNAVCRRFGESRVLVYGDPSSSNDLPSFGAQRVLGQDGFQFNTVNLIEGREFRFNSAGPSRWTPLPSRPAVCADTATTAFWDSKTRARCGPGRRPTW